MKHKNTTLQTYTERMSELYNIDTKTKKRLMAKHYKELFKYLTKGFPKDGDIL
tara:strand:+ start:209 stop:367 length:159 start_codon:yes stop_codon:yes gene_type:complete